MEQWKLTCFNIPWFSEFTHTHTHTIMQFSIIFKAKIKVDNRSRYYRYYHPFFFLSLFIPFFPLNLLIYLFIYLFIYFWLCWVSVSVRGLSLVVASGDHSSSQCAGLSLSRPLLLQSTGSRRAGSAVVAHRLSCSAACGILPDQGSNPCPLHWQADSQPLRHQGSPHPFLTDKGV